MPGVDDVRDGCYRFGMMKMLDTVIRDLLGTDLPIVNETGGALPEVHVQPDMGGKPWDRASDHCRAAGLQLYLKGHDNRPESFIVTSPRVYYQGA